MTVPPRSATALPFATDAALPWKAQLRDAVTTVAALDRHLSLTDEERAGAERAVAQGLPLRITPYYLSLCDPDDPDCPIRRQVVPVAAESVTGPHDLEDPLGEVAHEVAPFLVQRYPDRALLLAVDQCAIYCRFCTRSRMVGQGAGATPLSQLEAAFNYLRDHPEVREVIVSGGDPLCLSTDRLVRLLTRLRELPHLEVIRLATRVPVCLPQRVDDELVAALRRFHPVWIMTHFNHPKELTPEARAACETLVDAGFPVMNQSVLLKGINDDETTLETLCRQLIRSRVRPYYLLHMDPVVGTSHLRSTLKRGLELIDHLVGRVSGLAVPKFVCDTPGGLGKVPLSPDYVRAETAGVTTLRTYRGVDVDVHDPPTAVRASHSRDVDRES